MPFKINPFRENQGKDPETGSEKADALCTNCGHWYDSDHRKQRNHHTDKRCIVTK